MLNRPSSIIFSCKNLCKTLEGRKIIHNLSLDVRKGEIVALLGSNGSGKSTFFHIATGLMDPDKGDVWIDNQSVTSLELYERVQKGMRYISQEPALFQDLTTKQNLMCSAEIFLKSQQDWNPTVEKLLSDFNLNHIRDIRIKYLSEGELKKLELARMLIGPAKILLLDEPWSGVDMITVQKIKIFLKKIVQEKHVGILIADHNVAEALSFSDYGYLLHSGTVLDEKSASDLMNSTEVKKLL
jgi:lipopolysaccharide export system ATP-binding protein